MCGSGERRTGTFRLLVHGDVHRDPEAEHRPAEHDGLHARDLAEGVQDRHEHDHADLEEDGNRDDEGDDGQRHRDALRPEAVGEAFGKVLHSARDLDQTAQDRTEGDDDEHLAHGRADAVRDQGEDVTGGDLRREGDRDARDEQGDEGVHLLQDD